MATIMLLAAMSVGAAPPEGNAVPTARRCQREVSVDRVVAGAFIVDTAYAGAFGDVAGAHRTRTLSASRELWTVDALDRPSTVQLRDALRASGVPDASIELDLIRTTQRVPNDDGYPTQWPLPLLDLPRAWDVTTGDPTLVIAVVDTGIVDHPDLRDRLVAGYDFITDPSDSGDGDGRDADPTDVGNETDASSGFHGTFITGILGATTDNASGMAGVDWSARIQPVRALGVNHHEGRDSDIADAIRWAAGINVPGVPQNATPAKVINLSFGGPGYSQFLQDAVSEAVARGAIVIASAGNDGVDASQNVPSSLVDVVAVGAAAPDGTMADYSDYGPRIDVMAPGGSLFQDAPALQGVPGTVWSTSFVRATEQPVFAYAAGTSQAAAHASGVAALVRAAAPTLAPDVVASILRQTAVVPAVGCPDGCGAGLIDAGLAVEAARDIAVATCGSVGCGDVILAPAPLRPEEGCALSRASVCDVADDRRGFGIGLVLAALSAFTLRRRRARVAVAARRSAFLFVALFVALFVVLFGVGCGAHDGTRTTETVAPSPSIAILDPVPTLLDGQLSIEIGPAGRTITVAITPPAAASDLDEVDVVATDPQLLLARVAHGPFTFFIPGWVPGAEGRQVCIEATDGAGDQTATCVVAVP